MIFINRGIKTNEICYCNVFLLQKLPPGIYQFFGKFIFQQDSSPTHRVVAFTM